jgi:predicted O-methyltransferase YrrM
LHFGLWCLGLAEAETQTTAAERSCLARHATGKKQLVEIGVWHGVTTRLLRSTMAPDGVLYAVDPFPAGRLGFSMQEVIARREISGANHGRVHWMRTKSVDAAREYAGSGRPPCDFVFIDGDHSYDGLRADWESWISLVAPDGIIALHDSRSSARRSIDDAGSVRFTSDVILKDSRVAVVEVVDTLTVLRRQRAKQR